MNGDERKALEELLGHRFADAARLETALTHTSFLHEHRATGAEAYERLEFLGDAVLGLSIGHRLMQEFPERSEGELTKARAQLVNEQSLAEVALALDLGGRLRLGRGEERSGGRAKASLLADVFEAVVGAVFLDGGFAAADALVGRLFAERLRDAFAAVDGTNYKTRLQEQAQGRQKLQPRYQTVATSGPDHERTFEVEVSVGEKALARGFGRSRKEAEQEAARLALAAIASASAAEEGAAAQTITGVAAGSATGKSDRE